MRQMRMTGRALAVCACAMAVLGGHVSAARAQERAMQETEQATPERVRNTAEWNLTSRENLAIKGYDPVAYFPEGGGKATKGKPELTHVHKGVTYRFATRENLERFTKDPAKYEVSYGGWCAWAMREGDKVKVDPESFLVQGGRLFLFYDGWLGDTRSKWLKGDAEQERAEADAEWEAISGETASEKDDPATGTGDAESHD